MSNISNNNKAVNGETFEYSSVTAHPAAYNGQQKAVPGLVEGPVEAISKVAEGDVPFGSIVIQGTAANQAKVPTAVAGAANTRSMGVAVRSANYSTDYKSGCVANIADKGHVWMKHGDTTSLSISVGGVVYCTYDGKLKASQSSTDYFIVGKALTALSSSTSADDMILVDVNA